MKPAMTTRERMIAALAGKPVDRLPVIEWAIWWDKTIARWNTEGLAPGLSQQQIFEFFRLDMFYQIGLLTNDQTLPGPAYHGGPVIADEEAFARWLPHMFGQFGLDHLHNTCKALKEGHRKGDYFLWFTFDGFFWYPRTLFGIEEHLYAFYDHPDLMKEMNERLSDYYLKALDILYDSVTPEFMTFAEDMSYNHGPMISKALYDEFMTPYYRKVIPAIQAQGTRVLIDTDGNVEPLIPWFEEVGIEGVLPLERQAGVDVNRIRAQHPDWIMIGGYDKTIMHKGEDAMREEFERILPAIRSGRYVPGVDHQTPPDVSMENYRIYLKLLREYTAMI